GRTPAPSTGPPASRSRRGRCTGRSRAAEGPPGPRRARAAAPGCAGREQHGPGPPAPRRPAPATPAGPRSGPADERRGRPRPAGASDRKPPVAPARPGGASPHGYRTVIDVGRTPEPSWASHRLRCPDHDQTGETTMSRSIIAGLAVLAGAAYIAAP